MGIGQLRSSVQFKINIPDAKGAGYQDDWFDYGSTRGELKTKSGSRQLFSGEISYFNFHELTIRYQPYYDRPDMMLVIDGREFTIAAPPVHIDEGKKTYLKFTLNEKVNA